jgi:hypothetical protein
LAEDSFGISQMKLSVPSALRRGMSCHQEMGLAPAFSSAKMRKSVEERAPCGAKGGKERERERERKGERLEEEEVGGQKGQLSFALSSSSSLG